MRKRGELFYPKQIFVFGGETHPYAAAEPPIHHLSLQELRFVPPPVSSVSLQRVGGVQRGFALTLCAFQMESHRPGTCVHLLAL